MSKRLLTGLAVGVGCLAVSLTAGVGVASATPDIGPMVNTTCTYDQAMRAVHAENPWPRSTSTSRRPTCNFCRQFMASSPDQRVNLLKAIQNNPGADQAFPIFTADDDRLQELLSKAVRSSGCLICALLFAAQSAIGNPGLKSQSDSIRAMRASTASP